MWIFAYGSLIFRPDFSYVERRRAFVHGFARRFWQGSPDHRGVPEAPGRVVTLLRMEGALCGGCAYRLDPRDAEATLARLDHRERAGFDRVLLPLAAAPDGAPFADGITYVAAPHNPHFLGPLDEPAIARHVRVSRGPSGPNVDYVRELHAALRALDVDDPHVEAIVRALDAP
jgi:cation transport protein ChaC